VNIMYIYGDDDDSMWCVGIILGIIGIERHWENNLIISRNNWYKITKILE